MEEEVAKESQTNKDGKVNKEDKDTKSITKTTGTRLKERWLLTRRTWRYMSDAGKKLFPEGVHPHKKEDIAKIEEHFQEISDHCGEYILWNPNPPKDTEYDLSDSDDEGKWKVESEDQAHSIQGASSQSQYDIDRERSSSIGDLGWNLPSDIYSHLLRTFGASTLHRVASKILEECLLEEDELGYHEDEGELVEIDGRHMRSIGSQTDPYLDMSVQTDPDAGAQDYVEVGAETREETEAAFAQEKALLQEQLQKSESLGQNKPTQMKHLEQIHTPISRDVTLRLLHDDSGSLETVGHHDFQQQYDHNSLLPQIYASHLPQQQTSEQQQIQSEVQISSHQQQTQPPVLKKFWARRESLTAKSEVQQHQVGRGVGTAEKSKESIASKWTAAAKLATSNASSISSPKPEQPKQPEKKKQNVFKLGLKSDIEAQQGFNKLSVEKMTMDKFKTINYDKTLRNIKSRWIPSPEEEAYIRYLERKNVLEREGIVEKKSKTKEKEEKPNEKEKEKVKEKEKEKKKKKGRGVQVGEPLPQFILNNFRINSPVQIIHATRRRLRRFSSKTDSISEGEGSLSPSGMNSPRFSICICEEKGNRELTVSEEEAYKLTQMGIPFIYKGTSSSDVLMDMNDLDSGLKDPTSSSPGISAYSHHYHRSLSAVQASGYLSHILYNLKSARLGGGRGGGRAGERSHKMTHSLLKHLLPTVMQRTRGSAGGGHASRLVAKRIWRTRSKSQSRASAGTTSIWTPMGNCTWVSVTGRVSSLEATSLLQLSELERLALQRIALSKLQEMNLGCPIKIPKDTSSSSSNKKRRPYLLKRKALSTGFFDTKKDENRGTTGGLVFGLSLSKCLENERFRLRETSEREALALAAASTPPREEGEWSLSRKSSQAGSHASFASLLEGTKQSSTGSLESLNLERKRPSLGGSDVVATAGPASLDLLTIEPHPQVPALVSACCRFLEGYGLHTLGIFRVSSSKKRVRQLREEFDSGREVILTDDQCPHDVATLLKEFFRDLPEPLLTRELYEPLISTQKIRNRKLQFEALQYLLQLLPTVNRDTLYSLLNFLTTVAEHSSDAENDSSQGNKMDSSNLATLLAPNILHQVKPGSDTLSTSEMAAQAEERIDVINVVRSMIDRNKELFEVTPELLDETYQHLMDTHPESLDILLRRRCTGPDERSQQQQVQHLLATLLETSGIKRLASPTHFTPPLSPPGVPGLDLDIDTSSSVFEGSDASSPLPRSPTDHHDFEKLRSGLVMEDSEIVKRETPSGHDIPTERTRRRRRYDDEDMKRQHREKGSSEDSTMIEEKGWFRRREKSGTRELDRSLEHAPERTRWFRRRDKSSHKAPEEKLLTRQGSDNLKEKGSEKRQTNKFRERLGSQSSIDSHTDSRGRLLSEQDKLKVYEPTLRRLSSPEVDSLGVITASLKIPVPLHPQTSSLAFSQKTDIPYIEENNLTEEAKLRLKDINVTVSANSRQRTGSNDSFLGQPITGNMSFQPLSKKEHDKQSNDSFLSSSSMGVFTMSPSERNTPCSELPFPSETTSPMSGAVSPPIWLSPDSGTPGLSPPTSPTPPRRRSRQKEDASYPTASLMSTPLSHSATHTFGSKATVPSKMGEKSNRVYPAPIGRSLTSDGLKLDENHHISRATNDIPPRDEILRPIRTGIVASGVMVMEKDGNKKYNRRRYTGERRHSGHLPDVSCVPSHVTTSESSTQLWKRWEIISSDPTEPETFV